MTNYILPPMHIVLDVSAFDTLLSKPLAKKHIYCNFHKAYLTHAQLLKLTQLDIQSVSFCDGHTIYPNHELTRLRKGH